MPMLNKSVFHHPKKVQQNVLAKDQTEASDEEIDPLDAFMQDISSNVVKQETYDPKAETPAKAATTITFEDFQDLSGPK